MIAGMATRLLNHREWLPSRLEASSQTPFTKKMVRQHLVLLTDLYPYCLAYGMDSEEQYEDAYRKHLISLFILSITM